MSGVPTPQLATRMCNCCSCRLNTGMRCNRCLHCGAVDLSRLRPRTLEPIALIEFLDLREEAPEAEEREVEGRVLLLSEILSVFPSAMRPTNTFAYRLGAHSV